MGTEMLNEADRISRFREIMKPCIGVRFDESFIDVLQARGFFKAPASISYHGNYEGGLYDHSMVVTAELLKLTVKLKLVWQQETSPLMVGMFHDLCKMDDYVDNKGHWEHNKIKILNGHGDKSVMMLQQYAPLTDEEMCCIRWHMGAFDDKENWDCYGQAVTFYHNVLYTHTADMIAARIKLT